MNTTKKLAALFGLLGVLFLGAAVALSFSSLNATTRLLAVSGDAKRCTEDFMDALAGADFAAAETMLYGQPHLPTGDTMESELEKILWEAYEDSLSYDFSGECYASDSGICRDVQVEVLDIAKLLSEIKAQSQSLLEQRAVATEWEIAFDENGQYRESFAMDVLCDGVSALLEEGGSSKTVPLTLELICQDGQWVVFPNKGITNLLTGSIGE